LFDVVCLLRLAENGVDGLQFTRSWLTRSVECIKTRQLASESASASSAAAASLTAESEASASSSTPASSSVATAVINAAFLELLDWDDDLVFPEVISTPSLTLLCTDHVGWVIGNGRDPAGLETGRAFDLYKLAQCGRSQRDYGGPKVWHYFFH